MGPLPKTKSGHQYILIVMCSATRFLEAIPLRILKAKMVKKALIKFFTTFGLPKIIQTDQGTNFTSKVFVQVVDELQIKHVKSSPYYLESQGALARFDQTFKTMLHKRVGCWFAIITVCHQGGHSGILGVQHHGSGVWTCGP